ncbi:monooxygenase [Coemansia sp. RSA 552]|nr:monooxygenase [Coemansia sp. RSA 552]
MSTVTVDSSTGRIRICARRIGIIGAGPAGLAAARAFLEANSRARQANAAVPYTSITVLERNTAVGGIWNYTPDMTAHYNIPQDTAQQARTRHIDERSAVTHGFPTPIYQELHTNLPKDVMQFADVPFPPDTPLFPTWKHVQQYLHRFAQDHLPQESSPEFALHLNTEVTHTAFDDGCWTCNMHNLETNTRSVLEFDALLVCTGRVSHPLIPDVPGLSELARRDPGRIIHAKEYRRASDFTNQDVLVVGGASSGSDISRQLTFSAKSVHLSLSTTKAPNLDEINSDPLKLHLGDGSNPENPLHIHPRIRQFTPDHIEFYDGTQMPLPHTIIYATGYLTLYPFAPDVKPLPMAPKLKKPLTDGHSVYGLFRFLVNIGNPLFSVLGVPTRVVPFPLYDYQGTYLAQLYQGTIELPSFDDMLGQNQADLELPHPFVWAERQLDYMNELAQQVAQVQDNPRIHRVPNAWGERWMHSFLLRRKSLGY